MSQHTKRLTRIRREAKSRWTEGRVRAGLDEPTQIEIDLFFAAFNMGYRSGRVDGKSRPDHHTKGVDIRAKLEKEGIKVFSMFLTLLYTDKRGKEHRGVVNGDDEKLYDHENLVAFEFTGLDGVGLVDVIQLHNHLELGELAPIIMKEDSVKI